jgi:hypothetical protein
VVINHPNEYIFVIFKDFFKKEVNFGIMNCLSYSVKFPVFSMEF